jgi:hypothetical protein
MRVVEELVCRISDWSKRYAHKEGIRHHGYKADLHEGLAHREIAYKTGEIVSGPISEGTKDCSCTQF